MARNLAIGVNWQGKLDFKAAPQSGASKDWIFIMRWDPTTNNFNVISKAGGDPTTRR